MKGFYFLRYKFSRRNWWKRSQEPLEIKFQELPNLNFEKKSYNAFLSLLFLLIAFWVWFKKKIKPNLKTNFYFFDGVSKNCRIIKENATSWRALDIIYNKNPENVFEKFWSCLRSFRATKNRLKLVKYLLFKNIFEFSKKNYIPKIISIASGSAQGVLETIAQVKEKGILVKAILIDLDASALEHARELSQKLKIENQIKFVNKTASTVEEIGKEFRPNLIEMVGFLEYRPDEKAIKLLQSIYGVLEKGGILIVSQISPNLEKFFLKEVVNWPMIYRKPREFARIIFASGFDFKNVTFYCEPLKIHWIAECKKI